MREWTAALSTWGELSTGLWPVWVPPGASGRREETRVIFQRERCLAVNPLRQRGCSGPRVGAARAADSLAEGGILDCFMCIHVISVWGPETGCCRRCGDRARLLARLGKAQCLPGGESQQAGVTGPVAARLAVSVASSIMPRSGSSALC